MKKNIAIYARVSTDAQELKQQIEVCKKYCEVKGYDKNNIVVFKEIQGATKNRTVWNTLITDTLRGSFNVIVVFRIDRAWRSTRQFVMDYDTLSNRGVLVISVMEGLDPTTPFGKAMITVIVALAELERTNISIATKQRLQALKNMGKTLGRPKGSGDKKKRKVSGYRGNTNSTKKGGVKKRRRK